MPRFPNITHNPVDDANPAIQIFGRRFYKDQTPIEYLSEFLLVFASPKTQDGMQSFEFPLYTDTPTEELSYFPPFRLGLKLFAFLSASKLDTRHPVHIAAFQRAVTAILERSNCQNERDEGASVRLIQGLFSGFLGVAGDRTWTAHTFLPASATLLAREVLWSHAGKDGAQKGLPPDSTWEESQRYFNSSAHSFMARGGELLYLQLENLFNRYRAIPPASLPGLLGSKSYRHLDNVESIEKLRDELQLNLATLLRNGDRAIGPLGRFVDRALSDVEITGELRHPKAAYLGWVPSETSTEALLFAWEANNICMAQRGGLQKIALLRDLAVLHVMRSLCYQSARVTKREPTPDFSGAYGWIACSPYASDDSNTKKLSINVYARVEGMLFSALRDFDGYRGLPDVPKERERKLDDGDDNALRLFRKIGKQIGIIVPRKGPGMRMTLPSHLVRLLVAALIPPGDRLRLNDFYARIFAHYGLAIEQSLAAKALIANEAGEEATALEVDSSWFEEELKRGGFLIPLSDAVSLVANPYKG